MAEHPVATREADPVRGSKEGPGSVFIPGMRYQAIAVVAWSVIVAVSLGLNLVRERQSTRSLAQAQARAHFAKDQAFRLWSASHGGAYVPVDDRTPPNPYLDQVDERDILTPSGRRLTLMNPAYMVRQLGEDFADLYGVVGHITSLKPLRPENGPDAWEREALQAFERGESEVSEFTDVDGIPVLRLMRPMETLERCLKCHAFQGYEVGDVRGGVGITLPMAELFGRERRLISRLVQTHLLLWLTGLAVVLFFGGRLRDRVRRLQVAQRALDRANREWEKTFDAMPDLISIIDRDHRIVRANKAFADAVGLSPEACCGVLCYEMVHGTEAPPDDCPHTLLVNDLCGHSVEVFEPRLGGHFQVSIAPIFDVDGVLEGCVHVAHDISERLQAEERQRKGEARVQHLQKLEGLGVLAGGVAHDFNNILTGILGNADLALHDLGSEAQVRTNLEEIVTATQNAAELAQQMLAYSGKGRFFVEAIALSELVKEMTRLLEAVIPSDVELRFEMTDDAVAFEGDVSQIRQVFINLVTNASEAIGDGDGVVTIRTGKLFCRAEYLRESYLYEDQPEGIYTFLEVSDTGCGMDEETMAKIFDPFFSTKFTGRGLGMAAILGIVRGHAGAIMIDSEPGIGSTIRVLFPETPETGPAAEETA